MDKIILVSSIFGLLVALIQFTVIQMPVRDGLRVLGSSGRSSLARQKALVRA